MKKTFIPVLLLSLLLASLTACGAQAKQPDKPASQTVQATQTEAVKAEERSEATQEDQQEDNSKLYIAYRATYDCCVFYTSDSLEDQLNKYHAGAQHHEGRKRIGGRTWYNEEYGTRPM